MPKTTICLWFDHEGEEAAEFYTSLFPNSRVTDTSRYGDGGPGQSGAVMTVAFELDGASFVALNGGPAHASFTEAISVQIDCADQAEVDHYWNAFAEGGEESQCGWIKDRFGLSWQVVPRALPELLGSPDPEVAARVMAAMMEMQKLEVADLELAARS
ncbi:MAG: VOC family protein [Nocardioidaceae bacterium]|nr:VOC family protein [Nocardioidaceae bacterium]